MDIIQGIVAAVLFFVLFFGIAFILNMLLRMTWIMSFIFPIVVILIIDDVSFMSYLTEPDIAISSPRCKSYRVKDMGHPHFIGRIPRNNHFWNFH